MLLTMEQSRAVQKRDLRAAQTARVLMAQDVKMVGILSLASVAKTTPETSVKKAFHLRGDSQAMDSSVFIHFLRPFNCHG